MRRATRTSQSHARLTRLARDGITAARGSMLEDKSKPAGSSDDSGAPARTRDDATRRPHATMSGIPLDAVYGPEQGPSAEQIREEPDRIGRPGEFPFTRGVHATMYRGKPWTMRMFA